MRPFSLAAGLLAWTILRSGAEEPTWQTMPLPPEAESLNHTAESTAEPSAAARLYAQSIRLCASNGPALYGLGRILFDQGRVAEGLTVFRRLHSFFPNDPAVLEAQAAAIARLPEPRRADVAEGLAFAEQAAQLQPDDAEAWHVLSVLRHLAGDYVRAAEAAQQAVALDAQNPVDVETTALYRQQETACTDALSVFSPLE
jgi:Flp pilus assembly protein TadD